MEYVYKMVIIYIQLSSCVFDYILGVTFVKIQKYLAMVLNLVQIIVFQ